MSIVKGSGAAENVLESFHFLCKQKNYFPSSIMEHLLFEGNFDDSGDIYDNCQLCHNSPLQMCNTYK